MRHIASVSGGSIVNAALAQCGDFTAFRSEADSEADGGAARDQGRRFKDVTAPLAVALCRRGAFVFSRGAIWELGRWLLPRVGVLFVIIPAGIGITRAALDGRDLSGLPWLSMSIGAAVFLLLLVALWRGALQEALYASTLATLRDKRTANRLKNFSNPSNTTHVLVATDLISGNPVYFARDFVCCPAFGWGRPNKTKTATAVYASAAFPGIFPPRRLPRRRFAFQNGRATPPYPRLLKLSDGGVYNNLGTDWFDELNRQHTSEMWKFGRLGDPPLPRVDVQIIVNAGAASSGFRKVPPLMSLRRTMSVLYDNTVRPRIEALTRADRNRLVIDIHESPNDMARRLRNRALRTDAPEAKERAARATAVLKLLEFRSEDYWVDFARQTSNTKTKLTRAGVETGARMMLHGYLSCLTVLNIVEGVPLPDHILDEGYFLDMAGRSPTVSELTVHRGQPPQERDDPGPSEGEPEPIPPNGSEDLGHPQPVEIG